jgi:catechol 2,3-dioxygenase-like lactoylglutathione lyase family enzyme
MKLGQLDHVNVRTNNLDAMVSWYTKILGMQSGDRPNFPFPGAWMYAGGHPAVHLVGTSEDAGAGSETNLKLEHFAFTAIGFKEFEQRLVEAGEPYKIREVPGFGITQFNLWDPDGNHIHIDFSSSEVAKA